MTRSPSEEGLQKDYLKNAAEMVGLVVKFVSPYDKYTYATGDKPSTVGKRVLQAR